MLSGAADNAKPNMSLTEGCDQPLGSPYIPQCLGVEDHRHLTGVESVEVVIGNLDTDRGVGRQQRQQATEIELTFTGHLTMVEAVLHIVVEHGVEGSVVELHHGHQIRVEADQRQQAITPEHMPGIDAQTDVRTTRPIDEFGGVGGVRDRRERKELDGKRRAERRHPVGQGTQPPGRFGTVDIAAERRDHLHPIGAKGGDEVDEGVDVAIDEEGQRFEFDDPRAMVGDDGEQVVVAAARGPQPRVLADVQTEPVEPGASGCSTALLERGVADAEVGEHELASCGLRGHLSIMDDLGWMIWDG